jgi:hypothetical protein
MVQSRMAPQSAATSICKKKYRNAVSDGDRFSSIPRAVVRAVWCRLANRSKSRRLWQPLRMPSTATNSRYQAGMRMPRRIRVSGMARRKLIRSRSVAGACVSSRGKRRSHRGHRKLGPEARGLGTDFKSALRFSRSLCCATATGSPLVSSTCWSRRFTAGRSAWAGIAGPRGNCGAPTVSAAVRRPPGPSAETLGRPAGAGRQQRDLDLRPLLDRVALHLQMKVAADQGQRWLQA